MANIKDKDQYVYFLYSEQQLKIREKVEKTMSRVFVPGEVVINGRKMRFTEISRKPKNRYADCKLVAEGFKNNMVFTPISFR